MAGQPATTAIAGGIKEQLGVRCARGEIPGGIEIAFLHHYSSSSIMCTCSGMPSGHGPYSLVW